MVDVIAQTQPEKCIMADRWAGIVSAMITIVRKISQALERSVQIYALGHRATRVVIKAMAVPTTLTLFV